MDRVALFLNEVTSVLHELPQCDHRVIVYVEPVVRCPGFHGNQNNTGVQLLLENLKIKVTLIKYTHFTHKHLIWKHFSLVLEVTFNEYLVEVKFEFKTQNTKQSIVPIQCPRAALKIDRQHHLS